MSNSLEQVPIIKLLAINSIEQTQSQWCWAACGAMVAEYLLKKKVDQCTVANIYIKKFLAPSFSGDACLNPSNCNLPCQIDFLSGVYKLVNISSRLIPRPLSPNEIYRELYDYNRPIIAMIQYNNGAGHMLLLSGVHIQNTQDDIGIYVIDSRPNYSDGWIPYSALKSAWGYGSWIYSWAELEGA